MSKTIAPKIQQDAKIYAVPIAQMRVPPALVTQREFRKSHADRLAANMELEKLGLPTVNHRGEFFYIVDGQHRIAALRQCGLGDSTIDCRVYRNLTDKEMADAFIGLNAQLNVNTFSLFHLHCTAEHERESAIRRVVESNGCTISRAKNQNCIAAVTALGRVKDRGDDRVLGQVVRTLRDAYDGDASAFDGMMIDGLGQVFARFNGQTDEKRMVEQLSAITHGVRGVLRRAAEVQLKTGGQKTHCVAAVIVETYNRGLANDRKRRLPNWWQDQQRSPDSAKSTE